MNLEKNQINMLKKMMEESFKQDDLYTAGNYWKHYEKNIIKQVENNSLKHFRSWEGGAGLGNIQSFGGGDERIGRNFMRNFHPFDKDFKFFDNSFIVRKYNSLINKLIPYFSFFKYFAIRAAEARRYHKEYFDGFIFQKYNLIKELDKELAEISDSSFGLEKDNFTLIDNKIYTSLFLDHLLFIHQIKKNTEFEAINYILELGAGTGLLASAFLKLNKKIKYLIIDIPPTIFFSEYYLKNIGYKVFGYEDISKTNILDIKKIFEDYDVICLPSWKLNHLGNFQFDLFINIHSFQEMEKKQAMNYLSIFKKNLKNYIYLENEIEGHTKAVKKNEFGVLEQCKLEDVESYLSKEFNIVKKDINKQESNYKLLLKKK